MQTLVRSQILVISVGLLFVGFLTGCRSTGAGGVAYVTIQKRSAQEITAATIQVFTADGYQGGVIKPGKLVFEKPASRATTVAREGAVNAAYGAQTINRVRVELFRLSGGAYRLQCSAVMVTGGGDPFFQEESRVRSQPYQSLLDEVVESLK